MARTQTQIPKAGFMRQIEQCKADVREMAKTCPHLFPEWQALQNAELDLERAKARVADAKKTWDAKRR